MNEKRLSMVIRISPDTKEKLNKLRLYRRETFDEILCRVMDKAEKWDKAEKKKE